MVVHVQEIHRCSEIWSKFQTHQQTHTQHTHTHASTRKTCMRISHFNRYIIVYVYKHACAHTQTQTDRQTYTRARARAHTPRRAPACAHTHTHTHTHTQTEGGCGWYSYLLVFNAQSAGTVISRRVWIVSASVACRALDFPLMVVPVQEIRRCSEIWSKFQTHQETHTAT